MTTAMLLLIAACFAKHPGQITFLDRDTGTSEQKSAKDVPESVAWYTGEEGRVPVLRVEKTAASGRTEVFRYGPDGALLDVTVSQPRR